VCRSGSTVLLPAGHCDAPNDLTMRHLHGLRVPSGWPRVVRSKERQRIGAVMMKDIAEALLALQGLKRQNNWHFVLHSARRLVIDLACELMRRAMQVAHSRRGPSAVRGNMSSATIVFVLEELMRSQEAMCGDWGLMSPSGLASQRKGARSDGSQLASLPPAWRPEG
jgi:predicted naringenin-chalcone synthase